MATFILDRNQFDAVLFDLDGVLTDSATLHARSWKMLFDSFLEERDGTVRPFDVERDYRAYVDGKPRLDGIRSFLESRRMTLPEGEPEDPPDAPSIHGLGNRKNALFLRALAQHGVVTFPAAVRFLQQTREAGFKTALVSSSRNSRTLADKAGLIALFDAWIDGEAVQARRLKGKPAPDMFRAATADLRVRPSRSVVIEDAIAGVEAGRRGGFGLVIGVDRTHHPGALAEAGADIVVSSLNDIAIAGVEAKPIESLPSALESIDAIFAGTDHRRMVVCLDYDGTLTPIVDRPELALLSKQMQRCLDRLADLATVAIISGRDLQDLHDLVGLDHLYFAGSHGFEISKPDGEEQILHGLDHLPSLESAERALRGRLAPIHGVLVERKRLSLAVHYRLAGEDDRPKIKAIIDDVLERHPDLRRTLGKMVYDLQPEIDWHKGKAVNALLDAVKAESGEIFPIYIGDDVTDEDAFEALRGIGISIIVEGRPGSTLATFKLADTEKVGRFLEYLVRRLERRLGP
ncbi:MAG: trehalose-phosphatase [Geminicoccaceae bacterium]